jgi:alpha-beta hydrolase superfamily lysophospholipase
MASSSPTAVDPPRRRRRNYFLAALALVALVVFVVVAIASSVATQHIAPAPSRVGNPPPDLECEPVTITSDSGAEIAGWHLPADGKGGVIVLAHSIRGSRLSLVNRARVFHGAGYSVVLIDLGAHGESSGDYITFGHLEQHDVRAAVDFAKSRHPGEPVAVDGSSLGGAAALLASPLGIDALVVEAVYPTIEEAVENRTHMRVGPLAPLAAAILLWQFERRLGFEARNLSPIDKIASAGCPVLVLAGDQDLHTTLDQTRQLYGQAREPKELHIFEGAAHTDLERYDPERFRDVTLRFLNTHMRLASPLPLGRRSAVAEEG